MSNHSNPAIQGKWGITEQLINSQNINLTQLDKPFVNINQKAKSNHISTDFYYNV